VSVADLALDKEVDLRNFSSCWLSRPITLPSLNFRRILCFEPGHRGRAPEVVGDIFRSIVPFTAGWQPISQIAMPLVASGNMGEPREVMLEALTDASVHWLSTGLPLERIKIVLRHSDNSLKLRKTFARVKQRHAETVARVKQRYDDTVTPLPRLFRFDFFISYSHKNKREIDDLARELLVRRPSLRVFIDRLELRPGAAWQQHIFDSLDASRKVICVFSPDYLLSRICKEEFNIALFRHRETMDGVLLPLYLYTAELPTYMKLIQFNDVREADRVKIAQSAESFLKHL